MIALVYAAKDIWINVGDGNVECVTYDGPMGFEKGPRVLIRFRSGASKLLPEGVSLEIAIARLSGDPVTDLGGRWWCEGNLMELHGNVKCQKVLADIPHGPHGLEPGE